MVSDSPATATMPMAFTATHLTPPSESSRQPINDAITCLSPLVAVLPNCITAARAALPPLGDTSGDLNSFAPGLQIESSICVSSAGKLRFPAERRLYSKLAAAVAMLPQMILQKLPKDL